MQKFSHEFKKGHSVLHVAATGAGTEIGEMLIKAGARIDVYDHDHQTPLHHAVKFKNKEMMNFLLEYYLNVRNEHGLIEESSGEDIQPLSDSIAMTLDEEDEKVKEIYANSDIKRWYCVVDVPKINDPELFRSHHIGAILFCVGNATDEKSFLGLVRWCLRHRGFNFFDVLEYRESPIGSLRADMEQSCLKLENGAIEDFKAKGIANPVVCFSVPTILRY